MFVKFIFNEKQNRKSENVVAKYTLFFYKQHFYKQRQTEIDKKSSKCRATTWGWAFAYHTNIIGHVLKNKEKKKWARIHTINHKENEDEKWKIDHIDTI